VVMEMVMDEGLGVVVGVGMTVLVGVGNAVMGMLVGMRMGVRMVVGTTGNMVMMNVHSKRSFAFFLLLYPGDRVLSKHFFVT